jgi:hypothetical protein
MILIYLDHYFALKPLKNLKYQCPQQDIITMGNNIFPILDWRPDSGVFISLKVCRFIFIGNNVKLSP